MFKFWSWTNKEQFHNLVLNYVDEDHILVIFIHIEAAHTWIGEAVPGLVVNINCQRPSIKLELVCIICKNTWRQSKRHRFNKVEKLRPKIQKIKVGEPGQERLVELQEPAQHSQPPALKSSSL